MTFTMNSTEVAAAEQWRNEHRRPWWRRVGRCGQLEYRFQGAGIGTAISVHCKCGASKNVTDYGSW